MGVGETFDLAVVGAGPGGAAAAAAALEGGLSVVHLERGRHPRRKPCAGGLTVKSLRVLPPEIERVFRSTFEDVEFGGELPAFDPDTTMANVRRFAAATGMMGGRFTDHERARKEGLPGAVVPGVMSQGVLAAMIHRWAPGAEIVKIHTDNMLKIGTVGDIVAPFMWRNDLQNVKSITSKTYDFYWVYPYRPQQWWLQK